MLRSSGSDSWPPAGNECSVTVSPEAISSTGGVALSMYPHTMFSGAEEISWRRDMGSSVLLRMISDGDVAGQELTAGGVGAAGLDHAAARQHHESIGETDREVE